MRILLTPQEIRNRCLAGRIPFQELCEKAGISEGNFSRWTLDPERAQAIKLRDLQAMNRALCEIEIARRDYFLMLNPLPAPGAMEAA